MTVELDHISHSQLQLWDRCSRQWEYRYVKKYPSYPSSDLILGGAYHKALDVNYSQKITSFEDLPVEDCLDAFADEWKARIRSSERVIWGKKDANTQIGIGLGLVEEYMASRAYQIQPMYSERTFHTEVAGVDFTYVMDLQDENKIVIDHKTAGRAYQQRDINKDLQASAGAFVLDSQIVYHNHVAVKSRIPYIQVIKTIRLREDIDWWVAKVTLNIEQMRSGIAPPSIESWLCNPLYCPYWDDCRGELTRSTYV